MGWFNGVQVPTERKALKYSSVVCLADVGPGQCELDNSFAQFQGGQTRSEVPLSDIAPVMKQAVIAAEDQYFYTHSGVDPIGIARALYRDVRGSASRQGGSTITQQYVKNAYLSTEQSLERKLNEAAIAIKLERELSKDEIFERYLNEVYFGRTAYGVEAAAQAYFGKSADSLSLPEAAYLAGIIRSPNAYDAAKDPELATRQRGKVLQRMLDVGFINQEQFDEANGYTWIGHVKPVPKVSNGVNVSTRFQDLGGRLIANYALAHLRNLGYNDAAIYAKGLKVYLTIDPVAQQQAYDSIRKFLKQPDDPEASLVTLNTDGAIQAMVGGRDSGSEVNIALGKEGGGSGRQAASTMKPFMLAAFVDAGYSIKSQLPAPKALSFPKLDNGNSWDVDNFGGNDWGTLSVEEATWNSVNTVYAQILAKLGPKKLAEMAVAAGVDLDAESRKKPEASLVLGTGDVSPLGMARGFNTLAHHGILEPTYIISRVEDSDGKELYGSATDAKLAGKEAIKSDVADTVAGTLTGVIREGSGKRAQIGKASGGKTGTDTTSANAWFVGFTCEHTTSVWMGYPVDQKPMLNIGGFEQVNGGTLPALIWGDYMKNVAAHDAQCSFKSVNAGTEVFPIDTKLAPPSTTTTTVVGATSTTVPGATTTTVKGQSASTTTTQPSAKNSPTTTQPKATAPTTTKK